MDAMDAAPGRRQWPIGDREAFRDVLRLWVQYTWNTEQTVRSWWAALADAHLSVPTWAEPYGGLGATAAIQQVIEDELAAVGAIAPPRSGVGLHLVGPALRQHGSMAQAQRLLPPIVRGEEAWCLLVAEPQADGLLGTTTAARDTRDGFVVDGTKRSPGAELAGSGVLLARTDPDSSGRRGLTCFVTRLDRPGITITPGGDGGTTVVLDQVLVPRDDVVGQVGGGWAVAQTLAAHEQSSLAGRIRRGLVDVPAGAQAGNLDRRIADVLASRPAPQEPPHDRRS